MDRQERDPVDGQGEFELDLTRPRAPVEGQLAYESTVTAPTEWVPYVYTAAELQRLASRTGLSVASFVLGGLGLLLAIFGVWGVALSLAAVVLALVAQGSEHLGKTLRVYGLVTGLVGLAIVVLWFVYIAQTLAPPH